MITMNPVSCNLCNSNDASFLFKAKDRIHGIGHEFDYVRCNECGLIYMNPQVSEEDIPKLYPEGYGPHYLVPETMGRSGLVYWLRKHLMNVAKIEKLIHNSLGCNSKVLDVGCAQGTILNDLRTHTGCQVYGVDISEKAAASAKSLYGIDVVHGTIADAPWPDKYFDLITSWQCLEHLKDPHQTIEKMAQLLKNDGWLIVAIPNFGSLHAKLFKSKWWPLDCPRHLCQWSAKTIKLLMLKHGLEVKHIVYDATPWGLASTFQYVFYDNTENAAKHDRIFNTKFMRAALLPWMRLLSALHSSDNITVFVRKKC